MENDIIIVFKHLLFIQFFWATFYICYNCKSICYLPFRLTKVTLHTSVFFGLFTENHCCHRTSSLTVKVKGERKASNYRKEALH